MTDSNSSSSAPRRGPIAIVGVSALMPGSTDKQGFWSDILAGSDLGWALRVIPNQLYYSFCVPFVWWRFFAAR